MADNAGEDGDNSVVDVSKMKVADLKRELKARGLSTPGNKTELIERLQAALRASETGETGVGHESTEDEENAEDYGIEDDDLADDSKANDCIETSLTEDSAFTSPAYSELSPIKAVIEKENDLPSVNHKKATPLTVTTTEPKRRNSLSAEELKIIAIQEVGSVSEKLEQRAKRFNMPLSEDARKKARAERFGTSTMKTTSSGSVLKGYTAVLDKEKLKQRAERFGTSLSSQKGNTSEQLLKRKQRFGSASKDQELEEKKKKRAERFGT